MGAASTKRSPMRTVALVLVALLGLVKGIGFAFAPEAMATLTPTAAPAARLAMAAGSGGAAALLLFAAPAAAARLGACLRRRCGCGRRAALRAGRPLGGLHVLRSRDDPLPAGGAGAGRRRRVAAAPVDGGAVAGCAGRPVGVGLGRMRLPGRTGWRGRGFGLCRVVDRVGGGGVNPPPTLTAPTSARRWCAPPSAARARCPSSGWWSCCRNRAPSLSMEVAAARAASSG